MPKAKAQAEAAMAVKAATAVAPEDLQPASSEVVRPGQSLTAADLKARWKQVEGCTKVLGFYGHGRGEFACFSNFYDQARDPFDFDVPPEIFAPGMDSDGPLPRTVSCAFSEKAIMLCKAAVMGDAERYRQIAAASTPQKAKALGRGVRNWDQDLWERTVCSVAFEVVYQKFAKTKSIQPTLLRTGKRMIAEATSRDCIWGIGIDTDDERVMKPAAWQGSNLLGWALMEAREALQGNEAEATERDMVKGRHRIRGA